MKITKSPSTTSTATQFSKAWQSINRKLSNSKSRDKLNEFKGITAAAKPRGSTQTPIYEFYRAYRPATPHAVALLGATVSESAPGPGAQLPVDTTSEYDLEPENEPTAGIETRLDSQPDLEPQTEFERVAPSIPAPLSFASQEVISFLNAGQPCTAARTPQANVRHSGRHSSSSLLLSPPRRLPMPDLTTRYSRPNQSVEPPSPEEEIARLSHEIIMRDAMISDLHYKINVSQRRKACIKFSTWPWPCERSLRKTISELVEENDAKDKQISQWSLKYHDAIRGGRSNRERWSHDSSARGGEEIAPAASTSVR